MEDMGKIAGQEQAVRMLSKSLEMGTISHAYLFMGAAGIGKMHTARLFAESIISQSDKDAHLFFKDNVHPDILIIEKKTDKTVIMIEQITGEIEPWLALKPFRAARRVVIIRDAHLMRNEAANSLLKILEEPPEYAVIILISDENRILETILSRCQLIRFFAVHEQTIEKLLLERGIEPERAYRAARLSGGNIGRAIRFAEEDDFSSQWDLAREMVMNSSRRERIEIFLALEKMDSDADLISSMLETILRDIFIFQVTGEESTLIIPENLNMAKEMKKLNKFKVQEGIKAIAELRDLYRTNVNALTININICWALWEALQD